MLSLKRQCLLAAFLLAGVPAMVGALWWLCLHSNSMPFLPERGPAKWIVYPMAVDGAGYGDVELTTDFHRAFVLAQAPAMARLSVCSFKRCSITVNGQTNSLPTRVNGNWKQPAELDISGLLKPGTNEISVSVANESGPPALWLSITSGSETLNTDTNWEASLAGAAWKPAKLASARPEPGKGNALYGGERLAASLHSRFLFFLFFAALSAGAIAVGRWWLARRRQDGRPALSSSNWLLIGVGTVAVAWVVLWCHNLKLLPYGQGFDNGDHISYIQYILQHRALPLANEGYEMYQPPLYYLVSAAGLALLHLSPTSAGGVIALRLFGLACGLVTLIAVFLSLRLIFPGRPRAQFFGLLLAGFLPMSLYLFSYITNEILATMLAAISVFLCVRILVDDRVSLARHAVLGLSLGAALLAKSSTLAVVFLILVALAWNLLIRKSLLTRKRIACLLITSLACLAVCGWHYARVTRHFGNPLTGNWNANVGFLWWQQPGYRTSSDYLTFGRVLHDPYFSAFHGFPDGVYSTLWGDGLYGGDVDIRFRPPWNYELMTAGYVFALLPTLAIVLGIVIALVQFVRNPRAANFLMLSTVAALGTLMVYYSLKIPSYATAKAFYGSAALVPICVLGAVGWDFLTRKLGRLRHVLYVALGLWLINVYCSFWIREDKAETQILVARNLALQKLHEQSALRLAQVLQQSPDNLQAAALMTWELIELGHPESAEKTARDALRLAPDNADCHFALGKALAKQGRLDQAVEQARRALELAPEHWDAMSALPEWLYNSGRKKEAVDAGRESLRINPVNPKTHFALAASFADLGDQTNAAIHFRLATVLKTNWPDAYDRLGLALMALKQWDEASTNFLRAIAFNPQDPTFHYDLASCRAGQGKITAAITEYREVLKLHRKYVPALNDLAWILATYPDDGVRNGAEAVELASQACELSNRKNSIFLKTLAAAYAENGKFDEATATAREAIEAARTAGENDEIGANQKLLELYQAKLPYRQPITKP